MDTNKKPNTGKGKLVPCKSCGQTIASSAKRCPHCGAKNKKPIFKRVWFWVVIVILLLTAIGSSGEAKTSSGQVNVPAKIESETGTVTETTATETTPPQKEFYQVGDTVKSGDLEITYLASGEYQSGNQFMQPAQGNRFIFLKFAFVNTSTSSDASVSFYNFECYADGYNAQMKYFDEDTLSATLSAGRSTSGCVYFEVPADAQELEVEYTENVFSDKKIKFAYEGELNSGLTLAHGAEATADACSVGQSVESPYLRIAYLSCFLDSSNNQFITAKEGCHYVTCEFEFENLLTSDQNVSSFSFDCYADGIACTDAFFREDNLSATLSAGRKAKGTVTFEVPDGASVVEVEYLSNYWTSNRVVFDASNPSA